ncbi:MAG: Oligopeptide transport ATP-binding protein OppD [Mycobacterium sp.]|nr:Oligopeptide transport ATP-binding protein OppD [Mycobacterium sp.]
MTVLDIAGLTLGIGENEILRGVDLRLEAGRVQGLAGESGSGKTMTGLAVMGLLPSGSRTTGRITYGDHELLGLPPGRRNALRGTEIAMVFQDPSTSLHPMLSVGAQATDHLRHHLGLGRAAARERAVELLSRVRIPDPAGALRRYPHQFSGGQRQRIAIAIALACSPKVLIADEPTTALDVTVQAQILELLAELQGENHMALVLITHDLGVAADVADRIAVMYAGRVVESGAVRDLYRHPAHPYTEGLLRSVPRADQKGRELTPIAGSPPNPAHIPPGCPFHPRCPYARERCREEEPPLRTVGAGRVAACHYAEEVLGG